MSDDKKDPWLNYLALSTVVLAVCATLATFKAGGYSTRSVMSQTQASDQWAYFQAKSVKGYLYEMSREKLELELKSMWGKGQRGRSAEYEKMIAEYGNKIAKYDVEKNQIQKEAKRFERVRDDAQRHGQAFGIAVIFLQIAILLSSIAALLKQKLVWLLGLGIGIVGIVSFTNGFLLFM
ncbi:DUF4337 domain-containing protein [Geobacter argillaceus]|uniref:Uncharacterized protein DUF4337 n=1 Tax=Geobacter argillaceus TaxID=345631 RepID=A0A562WRH6_9BACT|nr:DUF4337 domain-containing protein [Geobacter argillaceus]TWJ33012.1 uncharacterized protein DUF4337 [Geobacter argillaceus]